MNNKLKKIAVIDDYFTEVTRERDPNDDQSGEDTFSNHDIRGIVRDSRGDIDVGFDVLPGVTYWLLYYYYDEYDSFSADENLIEFVGLYRDEKLAWQAADIINSSKPDYGEPWPMVLIPDDNGTFYRENIKGEDWGQSFRYAEIKAVKLIP